METVARLEDDNRKKYGAKDRDLIAESFEMSSDIGFAWCALNAIRYLKRFIRPGSTKAIQLIDLVKAKDYIERAIEKHPDNQKSK